jgi:metallothionein
MADAKKCAHPVCSCMVTGKKYCSEQCEAMEETPDIDCRCMHPECKGRAH